MAMQTFHLELDVDGEAGKPLFCGLHQPGSKRQTLVFLHGWLMSPHIWTGLAARLGEYGWPSCAIWQPGHGPVPGPKPGFRMERWADWLAAGLDRLGIGECILVGHSMGGILSLEFLARHSERVAGIALVGSSVGAWPEEHAALLVETARQVSGGWSPDAAEAMAPFLTGADFLTANDAWVHEWTEEVAGYDLSGHVALAEAFAGRRDHSAVLAGSRVPALVIHGEADMGLPADAARYSASLSGAIKLDLIPQCGHCPPLEAPDATLAALQAFLRGRG